MPSDITDDHRTSTRSRPGSCGTELWDRLTTRQRLARLLLVRSDMDADGLPDPGTFAAVAEGIGAFHGPPMLERAALRGPGAARAFNAALRQRGLDLFDLPPLIGGNAECGLSYTTGIGGTDVPYPAALAASDPSLSHDAGHLVGSEFSASGYSWAFQPVVDVRTATLDPVIGIRAFGTDPDTVSKHAQAYIQGMQSAGILACAKHFPGHGDSTVDSHLGLPVVPRTIEDHRAIHLAPFQSAIDAEVGTIMTAHVALPELGVPELATFSRAVCTDLLREELEFEGLLVTDSLRMRAVTEQMSYSQSFSASLRAGCDLMNIRCWPAEVPALLDELEAQYGTEDLPEAAIHGAFCRVVAAHEYVGPAAEVPVPERTIAFHDPRIRQGLSIDDPESRLPLPMPIGSTLGVMVDSPRGTDAPPLGLIDLLQEMLDVTVVRIGGDETDVDAILVVSYFQAGPSDAEREMCARAAAANVPAAVLLAGPPEGNPSSKALGNLPTVSIPALDVFGLSSRPALLVALPELLTAGIGRA